MVCQPASRTTTHMGIIYIYISVYIYIYLYLTTIFSPTMISKSHWLASPTLIFTPLAIFTIVCVSLNKTRYFLIYEISWWNYTQSPYEPWQSPYHSRLGCEESELEHYVIQRIIIHSGTGTKTGTGTRTGTRTRTRTWTRTGLGIGLGIGLGLGVGLELEME